MNTGGSSLRRAAALRRRDGRDNNGKLTILPCGRRRTAPRSRALLFAFGPGGPEPLDVRRQGPVGYGLPQLREQRQVIAQIMYRVESRAEDLVRTLQMVQVRAAEVAAGIAVA